MHGELAAITRPTITYGKYKEARGPYRFKAEIARWDDISGLDWKHPKRRAPLLAQAWLVDQLGPQAWGGYVDPDYHRTAVRKHGFLDPSDDALVYFDANRLWMAKWAGRVFFKQADHAAAFTIAWRGRTDGF